jgi:hypothetical protein
VRSALRRYMSKKEPEPEPEPGLGFAQPNLVRTLSDGERMKAKDARAAAAAAAKAEAAMGAELAETERSIAALQRELHPVGDVQPPQIGRALPEQAAAAAAAELTFTNLSSCKLGDPLHEAFLAEFDSSGCPAAVYLRRAVAGRRMQLKFHTTMVGDAGQQRPMYLIMVVGHNDFVLEKLGQSCGMPRGYPICWLPGVSVSSFGFKPKFQNDVREQIYEAPAGLNGIACFKKWSGFLGHLLVVRVNGRLRWIACTKNSAHSPSSMVQDAARIFRQFVTPSLIAAMHEQQLHLNAELMSFADQNHGAAVLRECPVVTSVGRGVYHLCVIRTPTRILT